MDQPTPSPATHQPPPHHPGSHCLSCGYDLTGVPFGPCPECGTYMGSDEERIFANRTKLVEGDRTEAAVWIFFVSVVGVGAHMIVTSLLALDPGIGIATSLLLILYIGVTLVLTVPVQFAFAASDRRMAAPLLVNRLWMVHLSWVVPIGCAAIAAAGSALDAALDAQAAIFAFVCVATLGLWCYGVYWGLTRYLDRLAQDLHARGIPYSDAARRAVILVLLILGILGTLLGLIDYASLVYSAREWTTALL